MIINLREHQEILESTESMAKEGFGFIAFPTDEVSDRTNVSYFKTDWEATEYCFEMSNDVDFYKSLPIQVVIRDLETIMLKGLNTLENEAIEISGMRKRYNDQQEFVNNNLNDDVMNDKNFDYLKDQVMYTGFGEGHVEDLKAKMQEQKSEFTLQHTEQYGKDTANATLKFRKSEQSDMYFFNSYKVELQKENPKNNIEQTFYINKGSNITMKEAYNLMEGRSVNKDLTAQDGNKYNAWVQIDFKDTDNNGNFRLNHFHENYGYDLEAALSKHAIKEMEVPKFRDDLMDSLKKGNIQSAIFLKEGTEIKQFIEANPQFKTINIFDENMKRLSNRQSNDEKQTEGQQQDSRQSKKESQGAADEAAEPSKQTNGKKKSQSNSM